MNTLRYDASRYGEGEGNGTILLRWTVCLLVVVTTHIAALLLLRTISSDHGIPVTPPPVLLELAPEPQAPPEPEHVEPPPPEPPPPEAVTPPPPEPPPPQEVPPPDPPPPAEIPPPEIAPTPPEVVLPEPPPPPPPPPRPHVVKRPLPEHVEQKPAPPPAPIQQATPAPVQAAPSPGAMPTTWQDALRAHLARFKRYPVQAQQRGEQGVALVRFVMNHAGMVLSVVVVRGSGHADLDQEALQWIERAQPLPRPPPEITRDPIELVIPLHFELR
jgi:protein TonB